MALFNPGCSTSVQQPGLKQHYKKRATSGHGAIELVEGVVYRLERN